MKSLNSKEYKILINHLLNYINKNDDREDLRDILIKLIGTKTIKEILPINELEKIKKLN